LKDDLARGDAALLQGRLQVGDGRFDDREGRLQGRFLSSRERRRRRNTRYGDDPPAHYLLLAAA
jgi:hypothetical protein